MTTLIIYPDDSAVPAEIVTAHAAIARHLQSIGVTFERWQADRVLEEGAGEEQVLDAYQDSVSYLMRKHGFRSADVISIAPDHPQRAALRSKFLDEHVHSEFEVRFFVEGKGLFYLHAGGKVFGVMCERGDLISVPAGVPHWFDMGAEPCFRCIRLFTTPQGWVADFTGSDIAKRYPTFERHDEVQLS